MKNSNIIRAALILLFGSGSFASQGSDPRAYSFITHGKEISKWLTDNEHPRIEVDGKALQQDIDILEMSLDANQSLINFASEVSIDDCNDVASKLGCSYLNPDGTIANIKIAGGSWGTLTETQKCELTAEILFLPYVKQYRHQKAAFVCAKMAESKRSASAQVFYNPEGHKVMITPAGVHMDGNFHAWKTKSSVTDSSSVKVEKDCIVLEKSERGSVIFVTWYGYYETRFCPDSIVRKHKSFNAALVVPVDISSESRVLDHENWRAVKSAIELHLGW